MTECAPTVGVPRATTCVEVEELYSVYNRDRFGGALPRYRIRLIRPRPVRYDAIRPTQLGGCNHERATVWVGVALGGELLRRVLVHEMCHIATRHVEERLHGPRFVECLKSAGAGEAWIEDEVAIYENRVFDYPPGLEESIVLGMVIDSVARLAPGRQWRRVRKVVASRADFTPAAFTRRFPDAAARWREATGNERWYLKTVRELRRVETQMS